MGALGGAVLGQAGLGAFDGAGILGAAGLEASPDGGLPGFELDFTAGLQTDVFFMNTATAMSLTDDGGSNSLTIPYTDPGNGERDGFYNDSAIYDGGDADVRFTFDWTGDAASTAQIFGIALFDNSNAHIPGGMALLAQRSGSLILQPRSFTTSIGIPVMANAGAAHTLTGGELTLDVDHTMGWSIDGINVTFFFDGVIIDGPFAMTGAEQTNVGAATRVGYFYLTGGTTSLLLSHLFTMEVRPLGTIYP